MHVAASISPFLFCGKPFHECGGMGVIELAAGHSLFAINQPCHYELALHGPSESAYQTPL